MEELKDFISLMTKAAEDVERHQKTDLTEKLSFYGYFIFFLFALPIFLIFTLVFILLIVVTIMVINDTLEMYKKPTTRLDDMEMGILEDGEYI